MEREHARGVSHGYVRIQAWKFFVFKLEYRYRLLKQG